MKVVGQRRDGAHHRRDRHRQGARRPGHPSHQRPRAAAVRGDQLRGRHRDAARKRVLRPREAAPSPAPRAEEGKLEEADGGTCSSTRSASSRSALQAKLLRVLQEREFERVGGTRSIKVDVRVVAATNRDLEQEIRRGAFREDLFYRLNVVAVAMPALRDRREDIPPWQRISFASMPGVARGGLSGCPSGVCLPDRVRLAGQRARARERGRAGDRPGHHGTNPA